MPCSGKTSLCNLLKDLSFANQIKTDQIWSKYFPNPSYNEEESNQVFYHLFEELATMIKNRLFDIIVEGVFATDTRILRIKEAASKDNYQVFCIYLHASLNCLLQRNGYRSGTKEFIEPKKFQILFDRFNSERFSDLSINTELETKENIINIIKSILQNGR